jgi:hypothetical protein
MSSSQIPKSRKQPFEDPAMATHKKSRSSVGSSRDRNSAIDPEPKFVLSAAMSALRNQQTAEVGLAEGGAGRLCHPRIQ